MTTPSAETLTRQNQARNNDGTYGHQALKEPSLAPLVPFNLNEALDTSTIEEGQTRSLEQDQHGIQGLGKVELTKSGSHIALTMHHPEDEDLSDLYNWDDGSRDVNARDDAISVLEDHMGVGPAAPGQLRDRVEVKDGRITFTMHEHVGKHPVLDLEDLEAWSQDFVAITDPKVREELSQDITDRYTAA